MQLTLSIEVLEVEAEDLRKRGSFGAPLLVIWKDMALQS